MDTALLKNELKTHIKNKSYCRFERSRIDDDPRYGFPIYVNEEFCLISYVYDFLPDGFVILRLKDITSLTSFNDLFLRLMKKEGYYDQIVFEPPYKAESLHMVLEKIKQNKEIVIIECERKDEFYIGRIEKVYKSLIYFRYFDGEAKWRVNADKISIGSITFISLRNRYINAYANHFKEIEA